MVLLRTSAGQEWTDSDFDPSVDDATVWVTQAMNSLPGGGANPIASPASGTVFILVPMVFKTRLVPRSGVTLDFCHNRVEARSPEGFILAKNIHRTNIRNGVVWPSGMTRLAAPTSNAPVAGVITLDMFYNGQPSEVHHLTIENLTILRASEDRNIEILHDGIVIKNEGAFHLDGTTLVVDSVGGASDLNTFKHIHIFGVRTGILLHHGNYLAGYDHGYLFANVMVDDFEVLLDMAVDPASSGLPRNWTVQQLIGIAGSRTRAGVYVGGERNYFSHVGTLNSKAGNSWHLRDPSREIYVTGYQMGIPTEEVPLALDGLFVIGPCGRVNTTAFECAP